MQKIWRRAKDIEGLGMGRNGKKIAHEAWKIKVFAATSVKNCIFLAVIEQMVISPDFLKLFDVTRQHVIRRQNF